MYLILNVTSTQIEIQELKDVMALLYSATPFLKMPFHKAIILRGGGVFFSMTVQSKSTLIFFTAFNHWEMHRIISQTVFSL